MNPGPSDHYEINDTTRFTMKGANMSKIDVKQLDTQALFSQALDVMNRAIQANKNDFPYQQLLAASEKVMDDKTFAVGITKEPGADPYDYYTVHYQDGRWALEGRGKQGEPSLNWRVDRDYLEKVVENPDRYIEHPEKLDLDWLKNRLGIG